MTASTTSKTKTVSAAHAKAHLSELLARVAYGGDHYIIERRGKPVAALVNVEDLERLQGELSEVHEEPKGFLALAGLWSGIMTDEEVDDFLRVVYDERERDKGRPVDLTGVLDD